MQNFLRSANLPSALAQIYANQRPQFQATPARPTILPFATGTHKEGYGNIGAGLGALLGKAYVEPWLKGREEKRQWEENPESVWEQAKITEQMVNNLPEGEREALYSSPKFQERMKGYADKVQYPSIIDRGGQLRFGVPMPKTEEEVRMNAYNQGKTPEDVKNFPWFAPKKTLAETEELTKKAEAWGASAAAKGRTAEDEIAIEQAKAEAQENIRLQADARRAAQENTKAMHKSILTAGQEYNKQAREITKQHLDGKVGKIDAMVAQAANVFSFLDATSAYTTLDPADPDYRIGEMALRQGAGYALSMIGQLAEAYSSLLDSHKYSDDQLQQLKSMAEYLYQAFDMRTPEGKPWNFLDGDKVMHAFELLNRKRTVTPFFGDQEAVRIPADADWFTEKMYQIFPLGRNE